MSSLSPRSRYFRLISAVKTLPPKLLEQFMDVDGNSRMALVATTTACSSEQFVGIARYCASPDSPGAEIAVVVADAWQRQGIGSFLVRALLGYAKSHGFRQMEGFVLPENSAMLAFARELGFSVHYDASDHLVHINFSLTPLPDADPALDGERLRMQLTRHEQLHASVQSERALSRWDNEGGAGIPGSQENPVHILNSARD